MTTEWKEPPDQELFDNAALGIMGQGFQRATVTTLKGKTVCCTLTPDGKRCALGHSIGDSRPGSRWTRQFARLEQRVLARELIDAHDGTLAVGAIPWTRHMADIAFRYGLDDSVLYFQETKSP